MNDAFGTSTGSRRPALIPGTNPTITGQTRQTLKRSLFDLPEEQFPIGFGGSSLMFQQQFQPFLRMPTPGLTLTASGMLLPQRLPIAPPSYPPKKFGFFEPQSASIPIGHVNENRTGVRPFQKKEVSRWNAKTSAATTAKKESASTNKEKSGENSSEVRRPALPASVAAAIEDHEKMEEQSTKASEKTALAEKAVQKQVQQAMAKAATDKPKSSSAAVHAAVGAKQQPASNGTAGSTPKAAPQTATSQKTSASYRSSGAVVDSPLPAKPSKPPAQTTNTTFASTSGASLASTGGEAKTAHSGTPEASKKPTYSIDSLNINELFAKMVWKKLETLKNPVRVSHLHGEIMTLLTQAIADEAAEEARAAGQE